MTKKQCQWYVDHIKKQNEKLKHSQRLGRAYMLISLCYFIATLVMIINK
jgi:hypothetical protein